MNKVLTTSDISISTGNNGYLSVPPFSPNVHYPEYAFSSDTISNKTNPAYKGIWEAFRLLRLDINNFGQKDWNPLGEIISSG